MHALHLTTDVSLAALVAPAEARAQADGAVAGRVRERGLERALAGAQVLVDARVGGVADTAGTYRVRSVRTGWHRVGARLTGYRGVVLDSVFVPAGSTVTQNFELEPNPLELEPVVVTAPYDAVLEPLATASEQKISEADLRSCR